MMMHIVITVAALSCSGCVLGGCGSYKRDPPKTPGQIREQNRQFRVEDRKNCLADGADEATTPGSYGKANVSSDAFNRCLDRIDQILHKDRDPEMDYQRRSYQLSCEETIRSGTCSVLPFK